MPRLSTEHLLDDHALAAIARPRCSELMAERPGLADADGSNRRFELADGPFDRYWRTIDVRAAPHGWLVTETIDFRIAAPLWRILLNPVVKRELRRPRLDAKLPWWAPPDRFDPTMTRTLSLLCIAVIITGYLGTLIGQTATFATDEFEVSDRVQGFLLAGVRVGTVITLIVATKADRGGRRRWLLASLAVGCMATVVGAASTGPWTLGLSQAIARGFATSITVLAGIMAAEVTPRNSRAYAASVLTLCAGLGSGMAVWFLPLADLGLRAWRILYVLPILGLPVAVWIARNLKETDRFNRQRELPASAGAPIMRSRLILVTTVAFLLVMFTAPASQFRNDFLRDERGFSAGQVSLFVLATNTPVGIGVAIAGKLADRRGRRPIAAFGVAGGAILTLCTYLFAGWGMWAASVFASIIGSMAVPALGVYQAELFGTSNRGRANGIITLIALAGGALGLLVVGDLSDRLGSFGAAFAIVAIAPLAVVAIVLACYPETAHRELEDLNPVG